jgi:predicted CopG family antitoxin
MASPTIFLDTEAYAALKSRRGNGESFSDVVKKIARPRRSIMNLVGAWTDLLPADVRSLERYYSDRKVDRRG